MHLMRYIYRIFLTKLCKKNCKDCEEKFIFLKIELLKIIFQFFVKFTEFFKLYKRKKNLWGLKNIETIFD